jgi:hypothetical protein
MIVMAESAPTAVVTPKVKPKPAPASASAFEMPKFEIPKFEIPKMEVPTAFREIAEKGVAQAKELTDHAQKVAAETVAPMKESFASVFNKAA